MVAKRFIGLFCIGLLTGCVTVSDNPTPIFNAEEAAEARIKLGLNQIKQQSYQQAYENLSIALKHTPKSYRAQNALAYYYQQVKEFDKAESIYRQALVDSPKNGDVKNNYGVFLCGLGRFDEGVAQFEQAVNVPDYYQIAATYENAGLCRVKQSDQAEAYRFFTKALNHEPYRATALLQRAKVAMALSKWPQAKSDLLKYQSRYGYRPETLMQLVQIEEQLGNRAEAIRYRATFQQTFPKLTLNTEERVHER